MSDLLGGPSWYEILGVSRDATAAEIRRAHRDLQRELEGDETDEARGRLAEADCALEVLRDPGRRRQHDQLVDGRLTFLGDQPETAGETDACRICGSGPTGEARLRRVTGAAILWVQTRTDGPFCRSCGTAVYRSFQDHSLKAGWWGVAALFYNGWALFENLASNRSYAALAPPEEREPEPTDSPRPLDPAPGLFRRTGPWVAIGLGILAVLALLFLLFPRGSGFSTDAADYIPDDVGGSPTDQDSEFAQSVARALEDPAVDEVRSATVGGGGTGTEALPELVLAAAETTDPEETQARLEQELVELENKIEREEIEGVTVQIFEVTGTQGGAGISFAFSSPDGRIVLWSIAFEGGTENAVAGMKAMLEAGGK